LYPEEKNTLCEPEINKEKSFSHFYQQIKSSFPQISGKPEGKIYISEKSCTLSFVHQQKKSQ